MVIFFSVQCGLIAAWLMMVIIRACHHWSPWYQQMCNQVGSRERRFLEEKKWVLNGFVWWPLQSQVIGGWLGVTYLSVLMVCIPSRFIRFVSFGHWGRPGRVASFHELWNQPTFLRWRLWFIQLCREPTILLWHHQGERHVWVLLLSLFSLCWCLMVCYWIHTLIPQNLMKFQCRDCYYLLQALFRVGCFGHCRSLFMSVCNIWVPMLSFLSTNYNKHKMAYKGDKKVNKRIRTSAVFTLIFKPFLCFTIRCPAY